MAIKIGGIFGFILTLGLGMMIGNLSQNNLINGIIFFVVGVILNIAILDTYMNIEIFKNYKEGLLKIFPLIVCIEFIGFIIGFSGIINLDFLVQNYDAAVLIFLAIFGMYALIRELIIYLLKKQSRKKDINKKIR
jgi:hypothetical protein